MSDAPDIYPPSQEFAARAHIGSMAEYEEMYRRSVDDNEGFWREQAARIDWFEPFTTVKDVSYASGDVHIRWYVGGKTNACYNALDRHVQAGNGDKTALIFEPDDPTTQEARHISYAEALRETQTMANVLTAHGVTKGDRITIYMPMIPEAAYAMLACARIGAIFSVIFGGFSPEAIAGRIRDADSDFVITADQGRRGGKTIALKANVDAALQKTDASGPTSATSSSSRTPAATSSGPRAATCGCTKQFKRQRPLASARARTWTPRTRCSSSTRAAAPARPRASSTRRAATPFTRR